jgi:hypothetical protein
MHGGMENTLLSFFYLATYPSIGRLYVLIVAHLTTKPSLREHSVTNHYMSVNRNPTASQQNAKFFFSSFAGVVDTSAYPLFSNISASFRKKFEMAPIRYSGFGETDSRIKPEGDNVCAAEAIFYCPTMNSHRPKSQVTSKEQALIPEKEIRRTWPRCHVSLEKSSKNHKPLEN